MNRSQGFELPLERLELYPAQVNKQGPGRGALGDLLRWFYSKSLKKVD